MIVVLVWFSNILFIQVKGGDFIKCKILSVKNRRYLVPINRYKINYKATIQCNKERLRCGSRNPKFKEASSMWIAIAPGGRRAIFVLKMCRASCSLQDNCSL